MKIEKLATGIKGRDGRIKTSGGGNFEGEIGAYDKDSNTIEIWNGWDKTTVDADKIVSVNTDGSWLAGLLIVAVIAFGVWVWGSVVKDRIDRHDRYDRYDKYDRYERYYR